MPIETSAGKIKTNLKNIKPAAYNPRTISEHQQKALKDSLEKFGDLSGIILNVRTGTLVGGHQRMRLMKQGYEIEKVASTDSTGTVAIGHIVTPFGKIPYREVNWDQNMEKAANVAANNIGGEWDNDKLSDLLSSIDQSQINLSYTGFSDNELTDLVAGFDPVENKKSLDAIISAQNDHIQNTVTQDKPMMANAPYVEPKPPAPPKPKKEEKQPDSWIAPDKRPDETPIATTEVTYNPPAKSDPDPPRGKPLINYNIIFDDQDQFEAHNHFIRLLKIKYPDCKTHAERLMEHLHAVCPEVFNH